MLKFQGKEYRNLEEQVQKNKEDIARHYEIDRALANLGIKIVGTVLTPSDLPDPSTYTGEYGDTYAVGDPDAVEAGTESYVYYVWTRPDPDAGEPNNHWLNVGRLSIVGPRGPEGPVGPQGPIGERGNRWCVGTAPTISDPKAGDMWLRVSQNPEEAGKVYTYNGYNWVEGTNIRGPQGIQGARGPAGPQGEAGPAGPAGPAGDVGGFINIWGILANASQLPNPATLSNLTVAYLVGTTLPYDLYVQVGETSETSVWENTGPFNAATAVSVEGIFQNVWNADTKLDKYTNVTEYNQAYIKAANGGEGTINVTKGAIGDAIPQRNSDGSITIPNEVPDFADRAISKGVADSSYVKSKTGTYKVYGRFFSEEDILWSATYSNNSNTVMIRDGGGRSSVSDPTADNHAVNKQYADTHYASKDDAVVSGYFLYSNGTDEGRAYHVMPKRFSDMIENGTLEIYEYFKSNEIEDYGSGILGTINNYFYPGAIFYNLHRDQFIYKGTNSTFTIDSIIWNPKK